MEQAGQGNRARDHAQKHKKSKPKYVPQTEKSNSDVPWKSKSKPLTSPIDLNKKMIFQKTTQNHELVKMEADKKILEKERRVYPEIPGLNIEKSSKDLQRCSASISRYRQMVKEEVESSVRNIKSTFVEMYKCLIDRETQLMFEVEKIKFEALETLLARQKKSEELRRIAELSGQRTDTEMVELRVQIKQFVSERKFDEELLKSGRIAYDTDKLKNQILNCGEISHPQNSYSVRKAGNPTLLFEKDSVTEAKTKVQRQSMQNTKDKSEVCVGGPGIPVISSTVPRGQFARSSKQGFGHYYRRNPEAKFLRTRMKEQTEFVTISLPTAQRSGINLTNEKKGQYNPRKNKYKRGTQNKEQLPAQKNTTECCQDSNQVDKIT